MTDTDLPTLARGVAERLGPLPPKGFVRYDDHGTLVSDIRDQDVDWLYSPEGAFWLLGQIDQQGLEIQTLFENALARQIPWVWKLTPEAVLRAAAAALGVRE